MTNDRLCGLGPWPSLAPGSATGLGGIFASQCEKEWIIAAILAYFVHVIVFLIQLSAL